MSKIELAVRQSRLSSGLESIPGYARGIVDEDLRRILSNSHETTPESELRACRAVLRAVTRHFGAYAPRGIERSAAGRPLPPYAAEFQFMGFTDCVDPETSARIAVVEEGVLSRLGAKVAHLHWARTEQLNPAAIRANVTSAYFERRLKQAADPECTGQLVILGNCAPRTPGNPDAKGCPFVLAVLEGEVLYLGTLNPGGTELQGVKPYVQELWHTTLGIEAVGTAGGRNPTGVFRSKDLLPLFERLVDGDDSVLDCALDPAAEIESITAVQIDSRDSFGNLKTNRPFAAMLMDLELAFGAQIRVRVGEVVCEGRVAHSHGDGRAPDRHGYPGELLLVPGSSPAHPHDAAITRADLVINNGDASALFRANQEGRQHECWAGLPVIIERRR